MLRRVRETIRILRKPSENLFTKPDIVFSEEPEVRTSGISRVIGGFIEVAVLAFAAGYVGSLVGHALFPKQTGFSVGTLSGIVAALLSLLGYQCLHVLNSKLQLRLKIGERIAPYFGHRLGRTYRTLKG